MTVRILTGDCRVALAGLEPASVQCCVTSPPYFGLRDYGHGDQIGLETTVEEYVDGMVKVFREVRRVLRDDGVVWLNLGDSYAANWNSQRKQGGAGLKHEQDRWRNTRTPGFAPKQLLGIPWRVALALQWDGWYLRSDCIWAKPNPMPESVTDRPTKAHEYVFLLTKHDRYFYDAEAAKEDSVRAGDIPGGGKGFIDYTTGGHNRDGLAAMSQRPVAPTRNLRTVWTIATKPFKGAHFATFPPELAQRCIVAGTSAKGQCPACGAPWERVTARGALAGEARIQDTERPAAEAKGLSGTSILRTNGRTWRETIDLGWQPTCTCDGEFVAEPLVLEEPERTWRRFVPGPGGVQEPVPQVLLDPFGGAGTTGLVASRLGRDAVLIELNPEYAAMARQRIEADAPMFSEVS